MTDASPGEGSSSSSKREIDSDDGGFTYDSDAYNDDLPYYVEAGATSLLLDDGRVVGAAALDLRRGELFAVSAKATVLATGHSDYLATRATATREQSADGIAMALRAGAEVANLEIQ